MVHKLPIEVHGLPVRTGRGTMLYLHLLTLKAPTKNRSRQPFLAHLSLLRVSFWDTVMSVVRRTCGRP